MIREEKKNKELKRNKQTNSTYFSIIVPCYNVEEYIQKTLLSILNQSYDNFEVIVIDDGSTDNTLKKIKKIKDKRLKIKTKENAGVSSARNLGIKISEGEYILFVDGDDTIEKDLLQNINNEASKEKNEIFSFGYRRINQTGEEIKVFKNNFYSDKKYNSQDFLGLFLSLEIPQSICTIVIKRDFLIRFKILFDEKLSLGEDTDFQTRLLVADKNIKIYYNSKIYYNYFDRKGSAVNNKISSKNFEFLSKFSNRIKNEENIELRKKYYQYLTICLFYLIKEIARNGSELNGVEIRKEIEKYKYILKNIKIIQFDRYSFLKILYFLNFKMLMFFLKKIGDRNE